MVNHRDFFVTFLRPMMAEFLGQFLFDFLHSCSAHTFGTSVTVGDNPLLPAVNDGLTIAVLIMLFAHISGGHFNFALTTAIFVAGKIKWCMVPLYLVAQVLGSMAGAGLAYVVNGEASGAFQLGPGVDIGRGILVETVLSGLLMLTVLITGIELGSTTGPIAVGFVVIANIMAGFPISGGCMNPTLSFGPAVVSGQWTNYWVYWVGPLLGAVIAATLFRLVLGEDDSRVICKYGRNIFDEKEESSTENVTIDGITNVSAEL